MKKKEWARPEEAALRRVLERNRGFAAEVILRLAWQAGLDRAELHALTWDAVDFAAGNLCLPDRAVPMEPELRACLEKQFARPSSRRSEYVILTDRQRTHPHMVHISRIAAAALDEEESLQGVTLKDLRDDFIIRCLESHGKAYAVRVGGVAMSTLYSTYGQYLSSSRVKTADGYPSGQFAPEEERLRQLLRAEGTSPAAVALWLLWKQNMNLSEIAALTWDAVDLTARVLRLPGGETPLHPEVAALLDEVRRGRLPEADPHVLLTPKSRRPFRRDRLDVVVRTALCQNDLTSLHLASLPHLDAKRETEETLLRLASEQGFVTRAAAMEALGVGETAAYRQIDRLVKQGKLVRVGARYYPAGTVAPPEQHYAIIRKRLEEEGVSSSGELATLLGIEKRACGHMLQKLVAEGKLLRRGQTYLLPEEGKGEKGEE